MLENVVSTIDIFGGQTIGTPQLYETRIENDANGNPLYVARSPIPNASTSDTIWYIQKLYYDSNGFLERVQQPSAGYAFKYSWDLRATYF